MANYLFIGLGGTGAQSIADLRKVFEERSNDTKILDDEGAKYDFTSIDSSPDAWRHKDQWKYFGKDLKLTESQRILLPPIKLSDLPALGILPEIAPWIGSTEEITHYVGGLDTEGGGGPGADQRRRIGRILFSREADAVKIDLQNRIRTLTDGALNSCNIHIFATVAGGTGSGGLIDLITMLRTHYSDAENYPIMVHVYATSTDVNADGVGYFFQNQYTTLRDLNALMCGNFKPHLPGADGGGNTFQGSKPINQVILATDVNTENQNLSLKTQTRITAEACYERIFAWETGKLNTKAQKAITLEDSIKTFPGEPIGGGPLQRSYRFASLGIRRWEVPNERMEELICNDIIFSSLKQMIYNNWQKDSGFIEEDGTIDERQSQTVLDELKGVARTTLNSGDSAVETKHNLEKQFREIAKNIDRGTESPLDELESEIEYFYKQRFDENGVDAFFNNLQNIRETKVSNLRSNIDKELSEAFLNVNSPLGLNHAISIINMFDAHIHQEIDRPSLELNQSLKERIRARKDEWEKIGFFTKKLTRKDDSLIRAHLNDLSNFYCHDFDYRAAKEDKEIYTLLLQQLNRLQSEYGKAREAIQDLINKLKDDIRTIDQDLREMNDQENANIYEFNQDNLDVFRQALETNSNLSKKNATAIRGNVCNLENSNAYLSRFSRKPEKEKANLYDRMRQVGKEAVKQDHTEIIQNPEVNPVLNASVLDRLEKRFAGNNEGLEEEAKEFIQKAASCSRLDNGETQPKTFMPGVDVPTMQTRMMVVGIPKHPYSDTIIDALKEAVPGGKRYHLDIYYHNDPSQLRLMVSDFWSAARFHRVVHRLKEKYQSAAEMAGGIAVPFFCNIDPDGQNNRRPDLMLPSASEQKEELRAALWIGKSLTDPAVIENEQGLTLVRHVPNEAPDTTKLDANEDAFLETADIPKMALVGGEVRSRIASSEDEELEHLREKVIERGKEIKNEQGVTSPGYTFWQPLRDKINELLG